ncbi:MAG: beta-glucuronidase [Fusobacteriaceae bacterium]|nr:beta-glucuronidase [Fusobacteriaceae bacterium]MBN2838364.1 beta-glucuronidase [Fusobacteriaceae bacterium]
MLDYSELYPINNEYRITQNLDGMWYMQFDQESKGIDDGWTNGLPNPISIPVPASFADFFTDHYSRDYCGDFWYEKDFFISKDWKEKETWIRFGSITHRGTVYCNGIEITSHEGGFLPVLANITDATKYGEMNKIVVKINNELNETSLPCGATKVFDNGRKLAKPYFDFFNYSGLQRSVWLLSIPRENIKDYSVDYALNGKDAEVKYEVITTGKNKVKVKLFDADKKIVAEQIGVQGVLQVKDAHLWQVRNSYLYNIVIQIIENEQIIDEYTEKIGIRTIRIDGTKILLNEQPVYLKGFGKHEDFSIFGRGFNWSIVKRDFECLKWSNANCFRTSHYPYAEEWYQFADEEGFLIINEVAAVGMMRSTRNFVAAGEGGNYTYFFETPTVEQLKLSHVRDVQEMITRDKNHPSVISWSLFNEPETITDHAYKYFKDIFEAARSFDPQNRPMTGAFEKNSKPELCKCYPLCDFICLNRYYGWYISGGPEIEEAEILFRDEMNRWEKKNLNIPFVFTEFGTDTMAGMHKLPSIMWSEEYQVEYLKMNFKVFDSYDFIQGELAWNFADFQTTEGIMRVDGNHKGVFTRDRQPKAAAVVFKHRWEKIL